MTLYLQIQEDVLKLANSYQSDSVSIWKDGHASGAVYPSDEGLNRLLIDVRYHKSP